MYSRAIELPDCKEIMIAPGLSLARYLGPVLPKMKQNEFALNVNTASSDQLIFIV